VKRVFFLDNLKTFLTMCVIIFHVGLTYGARQGWYYYEPSSGAFLNAFFTIFLSLMRSFGLEVFFFISGYFACASYDRHGPGVFLKQRLVRLGIPLAVFAVIIRPTLVYLFNPGPEVPYSLLGNIMSLRHVAPGPLWFVEILLLFSFVYALVRLVLERTPGGSLWRPAVPGVAAIVLFCLGLAAATFAVRIFYPVGTSLFHFRVATFPAHIAFFVLGIMAFRGDWLEAVNNRLMRRWAFVLAGSVLLFVAVTACQGVWGAGFRTFNGGLRWQAAFQTAWEPPFIVAITMVLLGLFKDRFNGGGQLAKALADNSYAVFFIHAPIAVLLSYAIRGLALYPLVKFAVAAMPSIALCYLTSYFLLRRLPYARKIL
jgi:surface polysaccharide O-acyltransferase-like enzyme